MPANQEIVTSAIHPGVSFPLFNAGRSFYFSLLTAALYARPRGGSWVLYSQGQGLKTKPFTEIEIWNTTANPIVFSISIGFGEFIDNRLITVGGVEQPVVFPTYDANSLAFNNLAIPDMSGQSFTDLNGVVWLAVARQALQIFNTDSGQAILLANDGLTKNVANVPPLTGITLPWSGNFRIKPPVANIAGIVSETYQAVKPTQLLSPPSQ